MHWGALGGGILEKLVTQVDFLESWWTRADTRRPIAIYARYLMFEHHFWSKHPFLAIIWLTFGTIDLEPSIRLEIRH